MGIERTSVLSIAIKKPFAKALVTIILFHFVKRSFAIIIEPSGGVEDSPTRRHLFIAQQGAVVIITQAGGSRVKNRRQSKINSSIKTGLTHLIVA